MNGTLYINNEGDFKVRYIDGDYQNIIDIVDDEFYLWFNLYIDQEGLELPVNFRLETVEVTERRAGESDRVEVKNYARWMV